MIIDTETPDGQELLTEIFLAGQWIGCGTGYSKALIDHGVPQFLANMLAKPEADLITTPLRQEDNENERILATLLDKFQHPKDGEQRTALYYQAYSEKTAIPFAEATPFDEAEVADLDDVDRATLAAWAMQDADREAQFDTEEAE